LGTRLGSIKNGGLGIRHLYPLEQEDVMLARNRQVSGRGTNGSFVLCLLQETYGT
jgi:hypothetical protein